MKGYILKNQKQIEIQIAEVKRLITEKQELQAIATFAGAERLLALFNKAKEFYLGAIQVLDEGNPSLDREYGKHRACLALINGFIDGMTGAEESLNQLKKKFLALNEELGKVIDKKIEHDKNRM
jgi:hypothetical protein